ncbi:MAG: LytTR family DNA-binding domain-containing protein [Candidatus Limiplasma sp.]|nr:LytTR family DNA-binding domain-containing protein [Candidatus Limiplasma sp.]
MEKLRVLIADDDAGMRDVLRRMAAKVEGCELVGEAENGQRALELVEKQRPHLVFLDIEMPEASGLECARIIQDLDPSILIVFATAHEAYMGDAFEVYAFDYLLKPFKMERVIQTLERARDRASLVNQKPVAAKLPGPDKAIPGRMMLHHRGGVSFLDLKDILLVQREDRATVLYTLGEGRYVTADTLGEMEERLQNGAFFRCHKSYIINLNHVKDITPYGRWTYVVRMNGTQHDALITHEKFEELERMFR